MLAALSVACATPAIVQLDPADESLLLRDVNVVDGSGAPADAHQDVLISKGRIQWIRPTGGILSATAPQGMEIVDGAGHSLLPGYVDAHVHVGGSGRLPGGSGMKTEGNLQRWLAVGVTTVFDMGGAGHELGVLQERTRSGEVLGPRIFHTNFAITGVGSHPIPLADHLTSVGSGVVGWVVPQVENEADIPRVLDTIDEVPIDYVKIIVDRLPAGTPIMDRAVLAALVKEARHRHHLVFVHAGDVDDALAAAEAGATALAHLPWRGDLTPEKAQRLKDSGVVVVTTAAMWEDTVGALEGHPHISEVDRDLIPPDVITAVETAPKADALKAVGMELRDATGQRAASLQALITAHVPLMVGTDAVLPGIWAGGSYLREVNFLIDHGVPVETLIPAMTMRPALVIGSPEFGRVAAGGIADLVLVEGDPFVDAHALTKPVCVWRRGQLVRRVESDGTLRATSCLPAWKKIGAEATQATAPPAVPPGEGTPADEDLR